jgi:hypothetical protein
VDATPLRGHRRDSNQERRADALLRRAFAGGGRRGGRAEHTGPEPSSAKRHTVVAIRTPKGGVNRPSAKELWTGAILSTLRTWLGAVFLTLFLWIVLAAIAYGGYALYRNWDLFVVVFFLVTAVALGVFVWLVVTPIVDARRVFRAAAALDEPPASAVPTMIS